jgi:hypothetical protein
MFNIFRKQSEKDNIAGLEPVSVLLRIPTHSYLLFIKVTSIIYLEKIMKTLDFYSFVAFK